MENFTKFEEILIRFTGVKSLTESTIRTYKRHIRNEESRFVIGNYLLINARSYIEVFEDFKKIPEKNEDIKLSILANEPFANKIQSWNGLRDLRNQVLAHGFDDKTGKTVANIEKFYTSKSIPTTDWEIILLGECAAFSCGCIMTKFDKELKSAQEKIGVFEPSSNGAKSKEEYIKSLQTLVNKSIEIDDVSKENLEHAIKHHVIDWANSL